MKGDVKRQDDFPVTITHKPHSTWGKTTNTNDINGRLGLGGSHKMAAVLRGATRRSPRAAGGQRLLRASPRGGDAAPFFCSARWGDEWGESLPWERDVQVSFPERSSLICCIFFFAVSYGLGLMHWHSSHLALFLCICAFCGSSDLDHNLFSCLLHLKEALFVCRAKWVCLIWCFWREGKDSAMYYEVNKESVTTRSV